VIEENTSMTFEQCQSVLVTIRKKQGTRCPLVRVDCGGLVVRGRLARSDSDPEFRRDNGSPYGVIVLEGIGLCRQPETIVQIASIPENGLRSIDE
jgi:hypothetical protein